MPIDRAGTARETFATALRLGLTSFGGPVAHLGYFERTYVRRLHWLGAQDYAGIVALCQLLPGPTSSQVGFLIGLRRAGWGGALAAWLGFTLPSALLMYLAARYASHLHDALAQSVLHGLKLAAVAVVAQAVWSLARMLCPDLRRATIAVICGLLALALSGTPFQALVLAVGAEAGVIFCSRIPVPALPMGRSGSMRDGWLGLGLFVLLLALLTGLAAAFPQGLTALCATFYRAGSLVFGGGHVVLPLLHNTLVSQHWLSEDRFLSGYGLAQALPGPLFTVAAFFGTASAPPHLGALWALAATLAIFLPGLLLAVAGHSLWNYTARHPAVRAAITGTNAAVVGLLAAALYDPVWSSSISTAADAATAFAALLLLAGRWKLPPILVVALCVGLALVGA